MIRSGHNNARSTLVEKKTAKQRYNTLLNSIL